MAADLAYLSKLLEDSVRGLGKHLSITPVRLVEGEFLTRIEVGPQHLQQDGFVHAGVLATLADHTAGFAAYSCIGPERRILTVEFKINFLRPAHAPRVECLGRVLKRGGRLLVTEAELFACRDDERTLVAKALLTMAAVPTERLRRQASEA